MTMIVKNLKRKNGERTVRRNMLEEEAIGGESMKKNKEKGKRSEGEKKKRRKRKRKKKKK